MRIGVVSDSHQDERSLKAAAQKAGHVDLWIHLGDYVRDSQALNECGAPVILIKGNCDFASEEELEKILPYENMRIFACHGHTRNVKTGTDALEMRAREAGCNIALYGHTHLPELTNKGDLIILNPGSTSKPRSGVPTFAIISDAGGKPNAEIIKL